MGRRISFVLVMLVVVPLTVWAQAGQAIWEYHPSGGAALDTSCAGPVHIPDGWLVKVYWDSDSTGPDLSDPQPPICTAPPNCTGGPAFSVNYNRFFTNGVEQTFGPGYFITGSYMRVSTNLPPRPRYYLRVYSPSDSTIAVWTSAVKTLHSGAQTIAFLRSEWTCTPPTPQCVVKDAHE